MTLQIHDTLQSTKFTPLQGQLTKFLYLLWTLGHKIVRKKIGGLPKVSRLKHEF